ncbi:phage portal protein [Subtercola sp. RTI3]|uniref:phage portal protein n=1 Tax=Subtercola sp. RTI3 TaxID=3048639 RepID=UPI002B225CA3|nr:phage portal protein [Subtercola sp. RTI3]MEA9983657.1 phage portal protein [Subtercola sp. RTI3]
MDAEEALKLVIRIHTRLNARRPEIDNRERYFHGEQPLSFATAEWKRANAARYDGFSDNWCGPVVNAEAERIKYTGIKINGEATAAKALHEEWLRNELDMQSSMGFVTTLATSRSFVIVWGDSDNNPIVTWEHPSQVEIEYDFVNPRLRRAALKTWMDDEKEYATLYTPTWLFKYERKRAVTRNDRQSQAKQNRPGYEGDWGWMPREIPAEPWPAVNPMGIVNVVEFQNRPTLLGDPVSEIQGVMPMQDAINLLWAYLFLSADYASMPARVVLASKPPMIPILDSEGKRIGEKPADIKDLAEKRLLYLSGESAKIDSWPAAALDVFTDTIEIAVGHIAAQTRTPPTYLVTNKGISNVNGDGLKASEIGLNKKVLEFQTFTNPAMRELFRLIALAKGDQALAEQARLAVPTWMNPEIRSEAQLADALLKKKQLGYPLEYLMEIDGLDPLEIERVMAMVEQEAVDPQITAATRGLAQLGSVPAVVA